MPLHFCIFCLFAFLSDILFQSVLLYNQNFHQKISGNNVVIIVKQCNAQADVIKVWTISYQTMPPNLIWTFRKFSLIDRKFTQIERKMQIDWKFTPIDRKYTLTDMKFTLIDMKFTLAGNSCWLTRNLHQLTGN